MPRPLATLLLLLTTLLWGLAFVAQKTAMESLGPLTFTAVRYALGGALVLPLAVWEYRRNRRPLPAGMGADCHSCALLLRRRHRTGRLTMTTVTNAGFLTGLYAFVLSWR